MIKHIKIFTILLFVGGSLSSPSFSYNFDKKMGMEGAQAVEEEMGIYTHEQATSLIQNLGARLVDQLGDQPFDYSFQIVDLEEPNAFALMGGYIYFSRDLLLLANSESELAGVMGHEIIHAHKRHHVKAARRGIVPGVLQLPGNLIGNVINHNLGQVINSPFQAMTSRFSRSQETQADRMGIKLAARAGYDPGELAVLLQKISDYAALATGENEKFSFFDEHPITKKRVKDVRKRAKKLKIANSPHITGNQEEFFNKFDGMLIGPNPKQGIFIKNVFLHADLNLKIVFPEEWITINDPSMVSAIQPDQEAQIIMSVVGNAGDPQIHADKFKKRIKKEFKAKPSEERVVSINNNRGIYLAIKEKSKNKKMTVHFLWISFGQNMYQFTGLGLDQHREAMKNSVLSIRPLSKNEMGKIKQVIVRIEKAQGGEILSGFSKRVGNVLEEDITALINGIKKDQKLFKGQNLKIGIEIPYINK